MSFSTIERRVHPRHRVPAGLTIEHVASDRCFPARTEDLSEGGLCMLVPANAPVRKGQEIAITFGWFAHDELDSFATTTRKAIIVRVNRQTLLDRGQLEVGARFEA